MSEAPTTPTPAATESLPAPVGRVEFTPPPAGNVYLGTGRRKSSIARVRLFAGTGKIFVNDRDLEKYFSEPGDRSAVLAPFELTNSKGLWDAKVRVAGGGHTGQSGAIRLGVARALVKYSERLDPVLRNAGFLTRDSREVERKKYGQSGARRRFQFSKR